MQVYLFSSPGEPPLKNIIAYYPYCDGKEREKADARISAYHLFHENPVITLDERAHILISDNKLEIISGECWLFKKNQPKIQIRQGETL